MDIGKTIGKMFNKKDKGSYVLTPLGKHKYDSFDTDEQGYRLDVLVYLNDHDASTVREISENMRIPEKSVKYILKEMEEQGWVIRKNTIGG